MSSRFPWRREAPSPPLPENLASEQRAADILSLRLSAPEPPPDFIYQRRSEAEPQQKKGGIRWMGPTILALVFAVSIGIGVLVVRGLRDGLVAERSDLPVITAQNEPAKQRVEEPSPPAAAASAAAPEPQSGEAPPRPSETLQRLLAGRPAAEPQAAPTPAPAPSGEARIAIPAAPEVPLPNPAVEPQIFASPPEPQRNLAPEPRQTARVAPPAPAAAPLPKAAPPTQYTVEVIAPTSLDEAKSEWARLQKSYPELLGDTTLELRRVALEGNRVVYRGLAGYLPSESTALDFCAQINVADAGQHCQVVARKANEPVAVAEAGTPESGSRDAAAVPDAGSADSSVVRLVKLGLKRAGLDPGALDGRATPQLNSAIREYQQTHGLGVDGQASRGLLDHMLGTQAAKIQPAAPAPTPAQAPSPAPAPRQATAAPAPSPAPAQAAPRVQEQTAALAPAPPVVSPTDPGAWNIRRGNELLTLGDIASARLFFEEAISQGSAAGHTALARTYDPLYFVEAQISGPEPDAERAVAHYSEAVQAGDKGAQAWLDRLRTWMQNR